MSTRTENSPLNGQEWACSVCGVIPDEYEPARGGWPTRTDSRPLRCFPCGHDNPLGMTPLPADLPVQGEPHSG